MQWVISQAPNDQATWPSHVPDKIAAAASCDASHLIDALAKSARIEDGAIVVPQWALFQVAAHLMHIHKFGFLSNEN